MNKENNRSRVCRGANHSSIFQVQSFNSNLLKGPNLLSNLTVVIMRFCENQISTCADIEQMFLQVKNEPKVLPFLRFLWKNNGHIETYKDTSQKFSATNSSYIPSYALRRSAQGNEKTYPGVQKVMERNIYLDDLYLAISSSDEASKNVFETRNVLAIGGFNLTEYNSNIQQIFGLLNPDIRLNPEISAPKCKRFLIYPGFRKPLHFLQSKNCSIGYNST